LPNRLKKFSPKIFSKKIAEIDENNLSILYNEDDNLWGVYIFNKKNFFEKKIFLRNLKNLKINVFKTFLVNFNNLNNTEKENLGKYLLIAGEFFCEKSQIKKGIFFIFQILFLRENNSNENENVEISLKLIDEKQIGNPIFDFCQMRNFFIFTCENLICSCEILLDNENREIEILPKYQQSFLNKLVSCCAINDNDNNFVENDFNSKKNKQILVGDVSESFHLMEMDAKNLRFNEIASDLNLRGLYKGNYFSLFCFIF